MYILGIESSCDETAAAVVADGRDICSSVISSQIKRHAAYGGVVPELAAREHLRNIEPIMEQALSEAGVGPEDLHGVAVTYTPGLIPALLVGTSFAKGFAERRGLPLLGVNHIVAHLYAGMMDQPDCLADEGAFPVIGLVVSGGHTLLTAVDGRGEITLLGQTLDDAAGEAFDKAAKILALGYPGGPLIDQLAAEGNPEAFDFPRGLVKKRGGNPSKRQRHQFNFSFSGLKTALYYQVKDREDLSDTATKDIIASYQEAVVDTLVHKTAAAVRAYQAPTVIVSGGVACNSRLRQKLQTLREETDTKNIVITAPALCTDNAAMVAGYGCELYKLGQFSDLRLQAGPTFDLPPETRLFQA